MEMLLEQAIKNLKYMCNHSNLEHDRKSLRTVIKFVESYDERLRNELMKLIDKTYEDFTNAPGGEGWCEIDGKEYHSDMGYVCRCIKKQNKENINASTNNVNG